jgi:hypothetical protein
VENPEEEEEDEKKKEKEEEYSKRGFSHSITYL